MGSLLIGRPGGAFVTIPRMAARGYQRTADAAAHVHRTLGGSYAVDRAGREPRTWQLDWKWLSADERRHLHALFTGQYGPGPWVLLDPATTNYLTPQQASGTDKAQDTSGFSIAAGGETLVSSTAQFVSGSRSLRWSLPAAVTSGILTLAAPPSLTAWATPEAEWWTFSGQLRGGGADPTVNVQLALRWLDAAGAQVAETLGPVVTLGAAAWSPPVVSGPCPAGAVQFVPRTKVAAASVTATADVYLDGLQLERSQAASPWMPGEGQPVVSAIGYPESVPFVERRDVSMTLVEVG